MLRIVFTGEDLGKVRLAQRPDPLWEIVLSLHQLCVDPTRAGPYAQWAGWVRTVARSRIAPAARVLHELAPPQRYFPDFLTPAEANDGLEAGLDALLHTPHVRVARELARAGATKRLPSWAHGLADGRTSRLTWLAGALRTYQREALEPFQDRLDAQVASHRAAVGATLLGHGVDALLSALGPQIKWMSPVLVADYPTDLTIELQGRGLTLVPSVFCRGTPVTLADDALDPVLVYPVNPPGDWIQPTQVTSGRDRDLDALVGATRARLLRALTTPSGTSQLSARVGLSMSSTSEQTTILRNAGLVTSTRRKRRVIHSLTPLGRSVLAGELLPSPQPARDHWCP